MMQLTPVLLVESIEKSLPFWIDRMGFEKTMQVPEAGRLDFVMLARDGAQLMMQTIESVRKDEPKFAPEGVSNVASLFIIVDDFADILKRLEGYAIALPERTTFYGMREIGVFEPGGHIAVFAARV